MPRKPNRTRGPQFTLVEVSPEDAKAARRAKLDVTIYDYGESTGHVWMFRDLVTGRDVASWVPHTQSLRVGSQCVCCVDLEAVIRVIVQSRAPLQGQNPARGRAG